MLYPAELRARFSSGSPAFIQERRDPQQTRQRAIAACRASDHHGLWLPRRFALRPLPTLALAFALAWPAAETLAAETVRVARVLEGPRLELDDGRRVRLAGLRVPAGEAHRAAAQAALAGLIADRGARLQPAAAGHDRWGELVAQVERDDGLWLQGALLEVGLAQLQTRPGEVERAAKMRAAERVARAAARGLWADPAQAPQAADDAHADIGSFRIVHGKVLRVAETRNFVYLNFGADWRTDFTLRLDKPAAAALAGALDAPLERLAGRRVEARGFLVEAGGPLIDVSHPEQIEVLP
jgi:micrococcal nuclease